LHAKALSAHSRIFILQYRFAKEAESGFFPFYAHRTPTMHLLWLNIMLETNMRRPWRILLVLAVAGILGNVPRVQQKESGSW